MVLGVEKLQDKCGGRVLCADKLNEYRGVWCRNIVVVMSSWSWASNEYEDDDLFCLHTVFVTQSSYEMVY